MQPPSNRGLWIARFVALLVTSVLALEAGSWGFLTFHRRADVSDLPRYVKTEILLRYLAFSRSDPARVIVAHPQLGWYRAPSSTGLIGKNLYINDSDGARDVPRASGPTMISTYGDSFTEGLEVDNDKTWPAQLSYKLGVTVKNYAVSGYGPDQALLYLEKNLEQGKGTPIVVLAFIPENLNRLVSAFRPFYTYPLVDFVAFKPMFFEAADGFHVKYFSPPQASYETLVTAARDASAVDYWFTAAKQVVSEAPRRFPYSRSLWHLLRENRKASPRALALQPAPPLARRVMRYIINRFYEDSRRYGFVPVVAALPGTPTDFSNGIKNLDELSSTAPDDLVFIDVSRSITHTQSADYRQMFGDTHYSARANHEVGEMLASHLRPYLEEVEDLRIFDQSGSYGRFGAGWYPEEVAGSMRWRWSGGERSVVGITARAAGPMTLMFRCKAFDVAGRSTQRVEIAINSQPLGKMDISSNDETYRIAVPASVIRHGQNVLEFRYLWSNTPQQLDSSSRDSRSLAVIWYELRLIRR